MTSIQESLKFAIERPAQAGCIRAAWEIVGTP